MHHDNNVPSVAATLASPTASYWLKDSLRTALRRDINDAARDARLLALLLEDAADRIARAASALREVQS
jgi:hypothetical protein